MDPLLEQAIEKGLLDKWDYCLRKLFVLRSTPLKRAISHLAPGVSTLLATLAQGSGHHSVDTSKRMRELSVQDWAALVQAFHAWPFATDVSLQLHPVGLRRANIIHNPGFAYNRFIFS
ncbi:hypothetical protein JVT61DRAFT_13419 [Boletus reticuloceps]|uniref:Uncharacterized protein n=1 Tax=Boletus reticuloceps TaxID=495285 RepID=A0A8I2YD92_9AGAM|nr:hypothetical protein JVT61DRAFT_13419 [Boletus reticuloceps]